jgi:O-methyltransferase
MEVAMHTRYGIQRLANRCGYTIERKIPSDLDAATTATIRRVAGLTMSSPAAVAALCSAVRYVVAQRVPGDFVECGVCRGGSMMAVALTLRQLEVTDRTLWLYDTYSGMTAPTAIDVRNVDGATPAPDFVSGCLNGGGHRWANASVAEARSNMESTGYPTDRIRYVVGRVEDTLPEEVPEQVALLRLDTDFHDSTRHELEHLYSRLVKRGVLLLDDYGSWQGFRKAVDDFVADGHPMHLVRVDPTVYLSMKP